MDHWIANIRADVAAWRRARISRRAERLGGIVLWTDSAVAVGAALTRATVKLDHPNPGGYDVRTWLHWRVRGVRRLRPAARGRGDGVLEVPVAGSARQVGAWDDQRGRAGRNGRHRSGARHGARGRAARVVEREVNMAYGALAHAVRWPDA